MKVFKGGISAHALEPVTEAVAIRSTASHVDLQFRVPAAGGGTSAIVLRMYLEDLPTLLHQVGEKIQGGNLILATAAAHSASVVNQRLRRSHEDAEALSEAAETLATFAFQEAIPTDEERDEADQRSRDLDQGIQGLIKRLAAMHAPEPPGEPLKLVRSDK